MSAYASDATTRRFTYDDRHLLTAHSDERGATTRYEFGAAARLARAVLPDGTVRASAGQNAAGLAEPSATFATPSNPAPLLAPEAAVARFTDGRGALRRTRVDAASRPLERTDALGRTTTTARDSQGNPVRLTDPLGHVTTMDYDARGLLTRTTDPNAAPQQRRGDDVGVEHQAHQRAFCERRSARILRISS